MAAADTRCTPRAPPPGLALKCRCLIVVIGVESLARVPPPCPCGESASPRTSLVYCRCGRLRVPHTHIMYRLIARASHFQKKERFSARVLSLAMSSAAGSTEPLPSLTCWYRHEPGSGCCCCSFCRCLSAWPQTWRGGRGLFFVFAVKGQGAHTRRGGRGLFFCFCSEGSRCAYQVVQRREHAKQSHGRAEDGRQRKRQCQQE